MVVFPPIIASLPTCKFFATSASPDMVVIPVIVVEGSTVIPVLSDFITQLPVVTLYKPKFPPPDATKRPDISVLATFTCASAKLFCVIDICPSPMFSISVSIFSTGASMLISVSFLITKCNPSAYCATISIKDVCVPSSPAVMIASFILTYSFPQLFVLVDVNSPVISPVTASNLILFKVPDCM